MKLQTASAVISFAKRLEGESAKFYQNLSQRYADGQGILSSFAKENDKNIVQIERAYYGVISDALEGCFAFNIDSDAYVIETLLAEDTSYSDARDKAIQLEKKIAEFYTDAAEQSKSLMADVPRAFTMVARKRGTRLAQLRSLEIQ
jgi:hypothetical protein